MSGEEFADGSAGCSMQATRKVSRSRKARLRSIIPDTFYAELQEAAKPFVGKWIKRMDGMGIDGSAMLNTYREGDHSNSRLNADTGNGPPQVARNLQRLN